MKQTSEIIQIACAMQGTTLPLRIKMQFFGIRDLLEMLHQSFLEITWLLAQWVEIIS